VSAAVVIDSLGRAIDGAVAGRHGALFELLARGARLPGPRMNTALAEALASACVQRGARADSVVLALARLSPSEAPGATALEFLPVCGLYALGARAAADQSVRGAFLAELQAHAADVRFRCREAVIHALTRIGHEAGDGLVRDVVAWMDGYFHAAAVLRAVCSEAWIGKLHDVDAVLARFDQAFALASGAPRAAARWPGYKELLLALEREPPRLALRFGAPVFGMLERWIKAQDSVLREVVARGLGSPKLAGRYASEVEHVRRTVAAARPPPRNPDHDVGPTRDRSHKRRRARPR
jgi:hypothetical protein